jgi:hypothetical protein
MLVIYVCGCQLKGSAVYYVAATVLLLLCLIAPPVGFPIMFAFAVLGARSLEGR